MITIRPSASRGSGRLERPGRGIQESAGADSNRLEVPRPTYGSVNAVRFARKRPFLNLTMQLALFQHLTAPPCGPNLTLFCPQVNPDEQFDLKLPHLSGVVSRLPNVIGMMPDLRSGGARASPGIQQSAFNHQHGEREQLRPQHDCGNISHPVLELGRLRRGPPQSSAHHMRRSAGVRGH